MEVRPRAGRITNILIELETDNGHIGIGEAVRYPFVRVVHEILKTMRPFVLGRDPFDHEVIIHELTQVWGWHHFLHSGNVAMGGVDIALWDLVGKSTKQPLYKLFGGAFRKQIPYYGWVLGKDLRAMAKDAKRLVAEGFDTIYVKLGNGADRDLEVVRTLRQAIGPRAKLRVDPNEGWSDGTAVALIKQLAPYDIEFFEQPLAYYDHEGAAHLRRSLGVNVAANQSAWTESDVLEIIRKRAADVVLMDQHQLGSLSRFRRAAWMLAVAGIPVIKHSFGDLGISGAAGMHVIASCPNFLRANQTHLTILSDDILEGGLPNFRDGCLTLPEGPELGVELDRKRVTKYAKYFEDHGEFPGYGTGMDLQKITAGSL